MVSRRRRRSFNKYNFNKCSQPTVKKLNNTIKKINNLYISDLHKNEFSVNCIHSTNNPNANNIFFIGGYITGSIDENDLNDSFWMAKTIESLDMKKNNIFTVNWDTRTLTKLKADFKKLYKNGLQLLKFYKAAVETISFTTAYKKSINTGKYLSKFLTIFNKNSNKKITLIGHSLGGKIIIECLNNLYLSGYHKQGKHYPVVSKAIILGTASYTNIEKLRNAAKATIYKNVNVYNPSDKILSIGLGIISKLLLFKITHNPSKIIGLRKVPYFNNIDCSQYMYRTIEKNCEKKCDNNKLWGHNYSEIMEWLLTKQKIMTFF